ncbi:DUF2989 domain-containing protein [Vibrio sp. ZSDZ34]|uniref:DUF2989 domain-containing protein n=1 Tax=Vibrio gelatinilyticus TaxID=2893468 RepID=A0A9X2AXE6_9VIBR|nr:DUF2989 domain-containing protein [Vibrio gelatinilyticus]MCJ2375462.1 DUF2989 domain-containing protein [Vibrio gelatinilyticus]
MPLIRTLLYALVALSLTGCFQSRKNTDQLCKNNESLECNKMNVNDGQCRVARTDVIWHRHQAQGDVSERSKIEEFRLFKTYQKCLELASQIQPIEQADLKALRYNALVYTIDEQTRISDELTNTSAPETLYFLWSETGSRLARQQFLRLEGTGALETSSLQYALATYYTTRDKEKTIVLLHRALELTAKDDLNVDIIKSLASVNQSLGRYEQSYTWAMVGRHFNVPIANDNELRLLYPFGDTTFTKLNSKANEIISSIEKGTYQQSYHQNH